MKLGYIGLGKMGMAMTERLLEKGHQVVVFNRSNDAVLQAEKLGAIASNSISDLTSKLENQKIIWLMVPWQAVDNVLEELIPNLNTGDVIIDGGNSPYYKTVERSEKLSEKGIKFLDVGVSGGPSGARNGACMMIGGDSDTYNNLQNLFADLSVENGYEYFGRSGSGHFVKMVHNGIEYGMMQAIGEGFEIIKKSEFDLDVSKVAKIYNHGSVIQSSLIGWLGDGYKKYGNDLEGISGSVSHSGEGQWTVDTAKKLKVKTPIIKGSLKFRKKSKNKPSYTGKVVSVLRNMFGGHSVDK